MDKIDFSELEKAYVYKKKFPNKSWGEIDIKIFLEENNIEFLEEVSGTITNNLTNQTINIRVDFYIPKCKIIIEYNGRQHYEPVEDFGGISEFRRQQKRDFWLRAMCKQHNFILIEIPYWDFHDKYYERILNLYNS